MCPSDSIQKETVGIKNYITEYKFIKTHTHTHTSEEVKTLLFTTLNELRLNPGHPSPDRLTQWTLTDNWDTSSLRT